MKHFFTVGAPLLFLAGAVCATPDLTVRREGFVRAGEAFRVVVENLGESPAPATVLELGDRPFAGGRSGTRNPYGPLRGEDYTWIDHERWGPDSVQVVIHLGRARESKRSRGRVRLQNGGELRLVDAREGVVRDEPGRSVSWDLELPLAGDRVVFRLAAEPGRPPVITFSSACRLVRGPSCLATWDGEFAEREIELVLDALDRPAAFRSRVPVPPLLPGERDTIRVEFPLVPEISVWIDPDEEIGEIREGNNVSIWKADAERWTLAALHVHSCFSEGQGSFDWQAHQAALSGYDLVWWSEHDWRVSCYEHLEEIGFESGEPIKIDAAGEGDGGLDFEKFSSGRRSLRLRTDAAGGVCRVALDTARRRFAYSLASDVRASARVLSSSLAPGDVFVIGFVLSQHPGERRRLVYEFVREGSPRQEPLGRSRWTSVRERTLPTGGWVRVPLDLTSDASAAWPNGEDDNLVEMFFELRATAAAEVHVDDLEFTHDICGNALTRVQEEWTRAYPNLAHEIGGEVSYLNPHLARYGGARELVEYDGTFASDEGSLGVAAAIVKRVREGGGLVSWCHPFGMSSNERKVERLGESHWNDVLAERLAGVDLLEVGYRNRGTKELDAYLRRWDRTTRESIVVTGIGVNDSHGTGWAPWQNNLATWIRAPASDTGALLDAAHAGHAFFGDPIRFRGRIELLCGEARGGDIVGGEAPRTVRVVLVGAGDDLTVRLITDGALHREWTEVAGDAELEQHLRAGEARFVRAEVWSAQGNPLAFTNPIYFDADGTLQRTRR